MRRSRELFFGGMGVALCVAATLAQAEVLLARPHQPTEAEPADQMYPESRKPNRE